MSRSRPAARVSAIITPLRHAVTSAKRGSRTRSTEGAKVLQRLLELPMPVVGVANGPATVHSEYLLLSDIHVASERATYGDSPHPAFGIRRRRPPRRVGGDRRNGARQVAALDRARRSTRRPRSSGAC